MRCMRCGDFGLLLLTAAAATLVYAGCDGDHAKPPATADLRQAAEVSTARDNSVPSESIEKSLAAAQSYLDSQEIDKAHAILLTLIDRAPREVTAREMLGQAYVFAALDAHTRGEHQRAKEMRGKAYEQYKIATEISPGVAGLQHSAGLMAMQAGHAVAALEHFQTAEKLDSRNPQYPLYAAQLLIQSRRYDDAAAALHRVLAIDPDEPMAHASLAMIALDQDRFDNALAQMAEARRIKPDDLGMRVQEAKIWRRKGLPQRGLELLIGLSAVDRAQEMVAFEIAFCFDEIGKPLEAAKTWQHVFESNQIGAGAWLAAVRTGEYLLKAGEREQAWLWLQQAQFAAPNASEVKALETALRQAH